MAQERESTTERLPDAHSRTNQSNSISGREDIPQNWRIWDPSESLELESLQKAIDKERRTLEHIRDTNYHLEKQNWDCEGEISRRTTEMAALDEEIFTVEQDLAATQAHASGDGTVSKQQLIDDFKELLRCIDDLTEAFKQLYRPFTTGRRLSRRRSDAIRAHIQENHWLEGAHQMVELAVGCSLSVVTECLIRHRLCHALIVHVFESFHAGSKPDGIDVEVLLETQHQVRVHQSQDHGGRWRSLTYRYATELNPRDTMWCASIISSIVQDLSTLLEIITDGHLKAESLETASQFILQTFNLAAKFKDKATIRCTERDTSVYLPWYQADFDVRWMEEAYIGQQPSREVILGISLALGLSRNILKDGSEVRRYECGYKASCIGNNSIMLA